MRRYFWTLAALLGAAVATVSAGDKWRLSRPRDCAPPSAAPCPQTPYHLFTDPNTPGSPLDPNAPSTPGQQPADSSFSQALASASEGGTQSGNSFMPGFFGDFIGGFTNDSLFGAEGIDITTASGMKIAESDSPRPLNRFYYLYNMYAGVPEGGANTLNVNRHIVGFEKTLGENASIGMRLPFFSLAGNSLSEGAVGDLSVIAKYALINNRQTGNVLSAGLVVTAPTGGQFSFSNRNFDVYFQPYLGWIYSPFSRLFMHAFHSVAIPTSDMQPTFMANSVGLGYWMTRDMSADFIRAFVPTVEVHVNTPFTNRDTTFGTRVQMLDSVNLTCGATVLLPRSRFGGAVSIPLAYGPHRIEALASYTYYFGGSSTQSFAGR